MRLILTLGIAAIAGSVALVFSHALGKVIDEAFDDFADDLWPASLLAQLPPFHREGF